MRICRGWALGTDERSRRNRLTRPGLAWRRLAAPVLCRPKPAVGQCARLPPARSRACLAGGGGALAAQVNKYDRAVAGSARRFRSRARGRARRGLRLLAVRRRSANVGPLNTKIDKMERNLDALQRKRSQLAGGGNPGAIARAFWLRSTPTVAATKRGRTATAGRRRAQRQLSSTGFSAAASARTTLWNDASTPALAAPRPRTMTTTVGATSSTAARQATSRGSSTDAARSRSAARPASSPPSACAPATAISSRCRAPRRRPISTATRRTANRACPGTEVQILLSAQLGEESAT